MVVQEDTANLNITDKGEMYSDAINPKILI